MVLGDWCGIFKEDGAHVLLLQVLVLLEVHRKVVLLSAERLLKGFFDLHIELLKKLLPLIA